VLWYLPNFPRNFPFFGSSLRKAVEKNKDVYDFVKKLEEAKKGDYQSYCGVKKLA